MLAMLVSVLDLHHRKKQREHVKCNTFRGEQTALEMCNNESKEEVRLQKHAGISNIHA